MIGLIVLIGVVLWIGNTHGDGAGTIALWVLIGALVIGLISAGGKVNKAHSNFIDYWADGGDRKK